MTSRDNIARMARDEARSRRAVLIVTRNAHEADKVTDALERALRPRDGHPKVLRGQGLWAVNSTEWGSGRIDVRVQGPGVRGMSVDTLLFDRRASKAAFQDARPSTLGSASPIECVW